MRRLISIFSILISTVAILAMPLSADAAYTGYSYRASLTIPSSWFDSNLTQFPVLFTQANLPAGIFTSANADGGDIRFSSDIDGNSPLNREIVSFDNSGNTAEIWVETNVSSSADTVIYVWYGHSTNTEPAASDPDEGSQGVWDSSFEGVYHMESTVSNSAGHYTDSTANGNHMTGTSMSVAPTAGPWGSGYSAEFEYSAGYLSIGSDIIGSNPATISAWGNSTFIFGDNAVAGIADTSTNSYNNILFFAGATGGDPISVTSRSGGSTYSASVGGYSSGTWYHVAGVWASATSRVAYQNGTAGTADTNSAAWDAAADTTSIGRRVQLTKDLGFVGKIDEVRFSSTNRSTAWLKAEYNSGNSPASITAGTPESPGGGGGGGTRTIRLSGGLRLLGGVRLLGNN